MITAERTSEVLSRLEAESGGTVSSASIARWTGRDERTARRWISGDSVPDLNDLHHLALYSRREDCLLAVLELLVGPLPVVAVVEEDLPNTLPGGYAEASEALLHLAEFMRSHSAALADDGRIDSAEAMRLLPLIGMTVQICASLRLRLERIACRTKASGTRHRAPEQERQISAGDAGLRLSETAPPAPIRVPFTGTPNGAQRRRPS